MKYSLHQDIYCIAIVKIRTWFYYNATFLNVKFITSLLFNQLYNLPQSQHLKPPQMQIIVYSGSEPLSLR